MPNLLPHGGTVSRNVLWACKPTALFLGENDFQIGCSSVRSPFLAGYGLPDRAAVSLSCTTFIFAINVIGNELEYLMRHYDASDILRLSAFHAHCLAVLVMAARVLPSAQTLHSRHFVISSGPYKTLGKSFLPLR